MPPKSLLEYIKGIEPWLLHDEEEVRKAGRRTIETLYTGFKGTGLKLFVPRGEVEIGRVEQRFGYSSLERMQITFIPHLSVG